MADERYLRTWVSDKLMTLMGYSQSVVVQYVIRLCKYSFFFSYFFLELLFFYLLLDVDMCFILKKIEI